MVEPAGPPVLGQVDVADETQAHDAAFRWQYA